MQIQQIIDVLEKLAPRALAEDWDNVGLLIGDATRDATRVMTCLTLSNDTVDEAVREQANLVVSHHPLPFRPVRTITTSSRDGALLMRLVESGVAVYSAHTAFDSAVEGINQRLISMFDVDEVAPLTPIALSADGNGAAGAGKGRIARLRTPTALGELAVQLKQHLGVAQIQSVGAAEQLIHQVAVACGSGGEFLPLAIAAGADCFITGEARFHDCLAAFDAQVAMLLLGHYSSERFAMEQLAAELSQRLPGVTAWASRNERDPLTWL